jgi:hypothetical protein
VFKALAALPPKSLKQYLFAKVASFRSSNRQHFPRAECFKSLSYPHAGRGTEINDRLQQNRPLVPGQAVDVIEHDEQTISDGVTIYLEAPFFQNQKTAQSIMSRHGLGFKRPKAVDRVTNPGLKIGGPIVELPTVRPWFGQWRRNLRNTRAQLYAIQVLRIRKAADRESSTQSS